MKGDLLTFDSFLDVANEAMCRPIRTLTEAKGYDTGLHNLASFGGAGGRKFVTSDCTLIN